MRCATCCRRSQPCSMVASVATRSSGCRSCARPVSARGSSMPRAAPAAGLRQFLPRSAVAVRYPGRRVSPQRVQDELIGQMSELLGIDYDVLALDLTESESRHRALVSDPTPPSAPPTLPEPGAIARAPIEPAPSPLQQHLLQATLRPRRRGPRTMRPRARHPRPALRQRLAVCLTSTSSPAPTTERLQSIQRMVADQLGDVLPPDFSANVLQSIPVQAGASIPSRTSGISTLASTHPTACASTSRSSRARSRARPTWTHVSRIVLTASGSRVVPRPRFRRRSHVPCSRCWFPWPVSSRPTSAWTSGTSSPTCQRCCMARANVMTTGPGD